MFRYIINETGLGIFARFKYKETLFTDSNIIFSQSVFGIEMTAFFVKNLTT